VPEPQTHYQLSFTARQALTLFVGFLLLLGVAYFLGLMTGLAGRESPKTAAAVATAIPERSEPPRVADADSTPIRPLRRAESAVTIPPFPKPVLGREPTSAPNLQFFEDRAESEAAASVSPTARPAPGRTPPPVAIAGDFWVQVLSASSEREARSRRDKLIRRGYRARILRAEGPRGTVFRVRVGPYGTREEAARASGRLSKEEKVQAWIVPAGR
jgi:DedD protein